MDKAARAALLTAKGMDKTSENIADYVADLLRQGRAKEVTDDLMAQADPQRLHHHYTTGNTGMDMPMDQASRMARAAQMGFGNTKWNHATALDDDEIHHFNGENVWLSEANKRGISHANDFSKMKAGNTKSPAIFPVYVRGPENRKNWEQHVKDVAEDVGSDPEGMQWNEAQQFVFGDNPSSVEAPKTGVNVYEDYPDMDQGRHSINNGIAHPTNIRSQFARFDPRLDHLAHLSASTGGAMDFARHVEAVQRAGGQIAPSKYLPNVPRQVHADGGKVAYHATHEPFEDYDWSRLGQSTKENTSGTSVDDWASSLASLGPWSHEKPLSKQLGMKTDLPVTLTGKEKKFKSLDHLAQEISQHGGPAALREKLVSQGYGHASVDDEEFGGKSYVGLSPDHFKITKAGGGSVEGDNGHIYVVHGGSDFDQIDPSYSGRGEPGNIRPLGNGLYGDVIDHTDPELAARSIEGAKHYARKYGRGEKTLHVFKVPKSSSTVFNGYREVNVENYPKPIEGLGLEPTEELNAYRAHENTPQPPYDPENSADYWAHSRKSTALWNAVKNAADLRMQHLPIGVTEVAIQNPKVATRIGKFSLDTPTSDILDAVKGDVQSRAAGGRIHAEGGGKMELRSRAAEAIRNQAQLKGSVDQLLAVAAKGKGVKQAELANAGRPSGNIISKEELARHFEDAVPKVQVKKLKNKEPEPLSSSEMAEYRRLAADPFGYGQDGYDRLQELEDRQHGEIKARYQQYTLPQGENYREHLLHLPENQQNQNPRELELREQQEEASKNRDYEGLDRIGAELEKIKSAEPNFRSTHWETPNVLAHIRMKDRDNGKTLHVEEVQSDWGQEGRERGFYDPKKPIEVFHTGTGETVHATDDMGEAKAKAEQLGPQYDYGRQDDEKPPQGPYVGNTQHWTDLALKHALTEAAKGGHDRVVFSPGQANADMYGQRNPITEADLVSDPNYPDILGHLHTYDSASRKQNAPIQVENETHLAKILGKEHARDILAEPLSNLSSSGMKSQFISGPDMHLGGHGMVDYYNNIVHPSALKLLQQHDPSIKPESYDLPNGYKGFGLPMTDTARQSILKNGFGAFKRGGMVGKEEGGSVTDTDEFRNWFRNSATHTDGDPHVLYTGTSKDKDFTSFNVGRHGAWFTRDPAEASEYAERNDSQGYKQDGWKLTPINTASRVIPAYVRAENPYTGDLPDEVLRDNYKKAQSDWFDTLRRKGHDSWIPARHNGNLVVVLKEPQQIKSIFNNGKFDPNQKHMNKAGGGTVGKAKGGSIGDNRINFIAGNHPEVPPVVYHGTLNDFQEFHPLSHFGTNDAAHERISNGSKANQGYWDSEGRLSRHVMPVHLSMKNPLDVGPENNWQDNKEMLRQVSNHLFKLSEQPSKGHYMNAAADIYDLVHDPRWGVAQNSLAGKAADVLKRIGYDGIMYTNTIEDPGNRSFVALHPNQIKSAIGNNGNFDPNNPDMTKSEGGMVGKEEGGATGSLREKALWPSAQAIKAGTGSREAHAELVNKIKPVSPYLAPVPPAPDQQVHDALTKDKQPKAFAPRALEEGTPVAVRLDIPAYEKRNTWVVSVHHPKSDFTAGEVIGYDSVAHIGNPRFGVHPTGALNIASGKPKATIATVHGNWKKTTPEDAFKLSQTIHNDPQWRQVGMDPERHSYFYDRETQEPVMSADEALHIGPLVYAKNPVYGKKTDFAFSKGGGVDSALALTRRFTKDGAGATMALKPKGK